MSVRNGLDVDDVEGMLEERDIERGEGHRERERAIQGKNALFNK